MRFLVRSVLVLLPIEICHSLAHKGQSIELVSQMVEIAEVIDQSVPLCSKLSQPRDHSLFPQTMSAHTVVAQELLCEVAIASSIDSQ